MSVVKVTPELQLDHELLKEQKRELWLTIIGIEVKKTPPAPDDQRRINLLRGILDMLDSLDEECDANKVGAKELDCIPA